MSVKRWLRMALIVLVIAGLLLGLLRVLTMEQETSAPSPVSAANNLAGPLVMQKSELFKQRDRMQREYTERIQGMGTATLLFTQPDAVFMDIVFPMMEKNGLAGMVAFGLDRHPGTEGCITLAQWRKLEAAGWEICLLWDGKTRLPLWMEQMNQIMAAYGLGTSLSVYVPEGVFTKDLLIQAREMNLKALVHHGEDEDESIQQTTIHANDVWTPTSVSWHLDDTSNKVESITTAGGSIVLEVKNEIMWEGGYRRLFQNMLEKLMAWQAADELRVTTINQAIAYRQGVLQGSSALEEEMRSHLDALDLQIDAIDEQLDLLYQPTAE